MKYTRKLKLRPWMILYAALVATLGVAGEQGGSLQWDGAGVSPVSIDAGLREVRIDSILRRSDI